MKFKLFDVVSYCGNGKFALDPKKGDVGVINGVNHDNTYSVKWKEQGAKISAWIKAEALQLVRSFEWP